MKNTYFKTGDGVDIYKIGDDILCFYKINSRHRIEIEVTEEIINLISELDGQKTIMEILKKLELEFDKDLETLLDFLLKNKLIYDIKLEEIQKFFLDCSEIERYQRQILFFEEFFLDNKYSLQNKLKKQTILIFGIGAIGSGICIQLAMMGCEKFIFVDNKRLKKNSITRHYYYNKIEEGNLKVDSLSEYLKKINPNIKIKKFAEKLDYDSDLKRYFNNNPTFVINTMDEPYIGLTSLKIGRECYSHNIGLFVGGGFDAHLMSTGELIIPNQTPCVDCYIDYFKKKLKNWNPIYNIDAIDYENTKEQIFELGGLPSMSLFSISYGTTEIVKYLLGYYDKEQPNIRGELLFDKIKIDYLEVTKNKKCIVCGDKSDI
ncbi:MAG: ThiF family adenylyltransferase [Leptotrichiaceae bacterium]|nr:ThiF family adenylyltransferase [Leptotrichiaceae bacterium]MBP9630204.1 ThiF family adenylyltransferase [Leptotrichiaceae bacterium]